MKMTKLRWWIIGLVCVGTIVNYLSRSSLSVAAPAMMKDSILMSNNIPGW